ncbi:MAG TPA: hypothetical protein VGO43_12995 [Pyrinomonadaceae bacterium]|jgi:hypothetical protein|nr:hypothetical protein [Pyrinomonadaceae bacterium]
MNGLQKFYIGLWVGFGLVIAGLAVSGNLTMLALTVLGFTAFGLVFTGMMCVLPTTVNHPIMGTGTPELTRPVTRVKAGPQRPPQRADRARSGVVGA